MKEKLIRALKWVNYNERQDIQFSDSLIVKFLLMVAAQLMPDHKTKFQIISLDLPSLVNVLSTVSFCSLILSNLNEKKFFWFLSKHFIFTGYTS